MSGIRRPEEGGEPTLEGPEGDGEPTLAGHPQPGAGEETEKVNMEAIIGQTGDEARGVVEQSPRERDYARMIDVEFTLPNADILRGRNFVEYNAGLKDCTLPGSAFIQTRIDDETTFTVGEESLKLERRGLVAQTRKIGGLAFYIRENREVLVVNEGKEPIAFRQNDNQYAREIDIALLSLAQAEEELGSGKKPPDLLGGSPTTTFAKKPEPKPAKRGVLAKIFRRKTAETSVQKSRIALVQNNLVEIDLTGITEGDLKCEALKLSIKLTENGNVIVTFNSKTYPVARQGRITLPNGLEIGLTGKYNEPNRLRLLNPNEIISFDCDCLLTPG